VSPDDSDEHPATNVSNRSKRKGKSNLITAENLLPRSTHEVEDDSSSRCDSGLRSSTTSRWRSRDESGSSRTLGDELDDSEGSQFETRFDDSRISSSGTGGDEDDESLDTKSDLTDDNSPYPQVRASVAATDNTSLSIDTPRMWCLSIIFAIAGSSTNLFFSLRYPSVSLTPIIALLLVHPLGLLWDQILKRRDDPDEIFLDGCRQKASYTSLTLQDKASWKRRLRLWLAQGRWNEKEHCCVYVSSNVSFGFAFATDVSTIERFWGSRC
jgi:hypothetical protein